MGTLRSKLFWLSFWVIGFAVFMTGLLLHFKYQSVFTGLQRDRVLMVADEITNIAQRSLALGQDFREMARMQDVIERRRETDPILLGIEVAAPDAQLVYATDSARIGTTLSPTWMEHFARASKSSTLEASSDQMVVAVGIRNSFNQLAGFVVVRYSRQAEHMALLGFQHRLWLSCGGAFVFFTLLLYAALVGLWRRTEADLDRAALALSNPTLAPAQLAAVSPALRRELEAIDSQLTTASSHLKVAQTGLVA